MSNFGEKVTNCLVTSAGQKIRENSGFPSGIEPHSFAFHLPVPCHCITKRAMMSKTMKGHSSPYEKWSSECRTTRIKALNI